jgi:heat shock protein HslJ
VRRFLIGMTVLALLAAVTFGMVAAQDEDDTNQDTATGGGGVVGVEWRWQGTTLVDGSVIAPPDPARYTLTLDAEGRATGQTDCNRFTGSYALAGDRLTLGPLATTLRACLPPSMDAQYNRGLSQVQTWRLLAGELLLDLDDGGTMRFSTAGRPDITGVEWHWQGTRMNDDTAFVPADPSGYTITLGPDGRLTGRSDCNRIMGSYTLAGNRVTIGPLASTRVLCPPGSLERDFNRQIEQVQTWFLRDGDLFLELPVDSGTMRFSPRP